MPFRPAVHAHDGGPGTFSGGRRDERLDPLTARAFEPERATRSAAGTPGRPAGAITVRPSSATIDGTCDGVAVQEPHGTVGSNRGTEDLTRGFPTSVARRRSGIDPYELIRSFELMASQDRGAVGPPPDRDHGSGEIDLEVVPLSGREIPDRRPFERTSLRREQQPLVAPDRAPRDGIEVRPLVDLLADGLAVGVYARAAPRVTMSPCSACRRQIKPAIGREPSRSRRVEATDPDGCAMRPDEPRSPADGDEVRTVVLLRAEPERDLARRPRTRSPGASPSGDLRSRAEAPTRRRRPPSIARSRPRRRPATTRPVRRARPTPLPHRPVRSRPGAALRCSGPWSRPARSHLSFETNARWSGALSIQAGKPI